MSPLVSAIVAPPRRVTAVQMTRRALVRIATSAAPARRLMASAGRELSRAAQIGTVVSEARASARGRAPSIYQASSYFGEGRDPTGDRRGLSGYASYDRVSSNADIAAFLLWRNFRVQRTLDVGCAKGYLVEALRERGVDAHWCDVSAFAVEHAAPGALGHVRLGDLIAGLPYGDGEFDLVSVLEILEHLPPEAVPEALREVRRVCGGIVYATIPSVGTNASGPTGHFDGKVRPERLEHYRALGPDYPGPVPQEDLAVDAQGAPIEGHLCIASFEWWSTQFAQAGFERWVEVERRLYADIEPAGLEQFWNLYVFALPETSPALATPRHPASTLRDLGLHHPLIEHRMARSPIGQNP
jgi:SAM-dependent methyltransferase